MTAKAANYNDDYYGRTQEFLYELCSDLKDEDGEAPSAEDILELLRVALNNLPDELLSGVASGDIVSLGIKRKQRSKHKLAPGDLVCVPLGGGISTLSVFLGKNHIGYAFGCLIPPLNKSPRMQSIKRMSLSPLFACYIDIAPIETGAWRIVGNSCDLLNAFHKDPEIYHKKKHHISNPRIGEFGAAETIDSKLRNIERAEAERVGLLDDSYRLIHSPKSLISYIERRLAR